MKKAFLIVLIILVSTILILAAIKFEIQEIIKIAPQEGPKIDFEETGNLIRNNPGLKPNVWYFLYEKPGAPAIAVEILFDSGSICISGANRTACSENTFAEGERVNIKGSRERSVIRVLELKREEEVKLRKVYLYYYNPQMDQDETGNIMCSRQGLVPVERQIPLTITPIQDTIRLLIQGGLMPAENNQGITTEYPLEGLSLEGASLKNGVLTLTFDDPSNKTGGGSCRVGILWFQIEATARQFEGVNEVKFYPEELFQP